MKKEFQNRLINHFKIEIKLFYNVRKKPKETPKIPFF